LTQEEIAAQASEADDVEESGEAGEDLGPMPDLALSPDAIFERLGAGIDDEEKSLDLSGFFDEEEAEPEEQATTEERSEPEAAEPELEEIAPETDESETGGDLLPELDFDAESTDGGFLPDPFGDDEPEVQTEERAWFIVHCYSGYEHKVRHNLEQRIESMAMQEFIYQVVVPTVEEIELKDGKRRTVERCLYPGYLMVQMLLTDDSWYVVRNTPGVTGFVGMGNRPTPLRSEAVMRILRRMESNAPEVRATFKRNQKVRIVEGPFADFIGTVDDIDEERTKVRVLVSFFGRETPVELDFLQVEKT